MRIAPSGKVRTVALGNGKLIKVKLDAVVLDPAMKMRSRFWGT